MLRLTFEYKQRHMIKKTASHIKLSEYDQEIPQSRNADQPKAPGVRAT